MKNRKYSITGHMVVRNEDRWIWYAIMSVIDYLDKILIYDTGSIDKTNDIIRWFLEKEEYRKKIQYKEWGIVKPKDFYRVRQDQINNTNSDYFMVIDGDEIWYRKSLDELDEIISSEKPQLIATRFINVCGDVFHYRYDNRETYCIAGQTGAITIRVYSMSIPGINCGGTYGVEGYFDEHGIPVQEAGYTIKVQNGNYMHTSLLLRSSAQLGDFSIKYRQKKIRADWDEKFTEDFAFPEVFSDDRRPDIVKSPYEKENNLVRTVYRLAKRAKGLLKK